jgi:pilus assembly protein CpaD
MSSIDKPRRLPFVRYPLAALVATAAVVILPGCRPGEEETKVAGWSLVDPSQRHPIMVSQQPTNLSVRVAKGSYGLSPHQRSQVISFLERYRAVESGNSKLVIEAPSGGANEVASMQAVAEIRALMTEIGFGAAGIGVEAYQASSDQQPAIRVSFMQYVAEGPQCGRWPGNLAQTDSNLNYPNMGCASQKNFAAMVANPADLLGPRTMTPSSRERRDTVWDKYVKGETTAATKSEDERVRVKGSN